MATTLDVNVKEHRKKRVKTDKYEKDLETTLDRLEDLHAKFAGDDGLVAKEEFIQALGSDGAAICRKVSHYKRKVLL